MSKSSVVDAWNEETMNYAERPSTSESGTQRIARTYPPPSELEAPSVLDRDALCGILSDYVARVADIGPSQGARTVREELDALGVLGELVPQPLAGQLVCALAKRLPRAEQRRDFLGNAWLILRRGLLPHSRPPLPPAC